MGEPGRGYLWVLSRTPQMDLAVYEGILKRASAQGYNLGRLLKPRQTP